MAGGAAWSQEKGGETAFYLTGEGVITDTQLLAAAADAVGGRYCEDCHVCEVNDVATSRVGVRSYALNLAHANDLWRKSEEMVGERFAF